MYKPPKVSDGERYWGSAPPQLSDRCQYWVRQIERGWWPNRWYWRECYSCRADILGVYIWENQNVIEPLLREKRP
jgi:hypothetical protein